MLSIAVVVSLCYNHRQDSHEQLLIWRAGNRWVIETALPSSTNSQHEADQEAEFPQNHVQEPASTTTSERNQTTRPAQGPIRSTDNSKPVAAELKSIDFFSRWLVILTLHTEAGRNEKYVIACDSLSENTFRLLRVRLRIEGFILLNPEKKPEA